MSQYLLDCSGNSCTMVPYTPPSAFTEHGFSGTTIVTFYVVLSVLTLVIVAATAIVRYKAHEERGDTERTRICNPPTQCPTCGANQETIKSKSPY